MTDTKDLFDVIEVDIKTQAIRILARAKNERAAEGIEMSAIFRRGVETAFYVSVPAGKYQDGDILR